QVDWKSTLNLYNKTIGANQKADLTIKTFPNGNHTIQQCESGGLNEDLAKFNYSVCEGYYEAMEIWLTQLTHKKRP
ncbi:MAG: hypothetical protein AAF206_29125, partial [Bacteroidota bacterium]